MAGETEYSLGLDIGEPNWRAATAWVGQDGRPHVDVVDLASDSPVRAAKVVMVVLPADRRSDTDAIAVDVVTRLGSRLGGGIDRVRFVEQLAARDLGAQYLSASGSTDLAATVAAIGAALAGLETDQRSIAAMLAAGTAGGAAGVAGGIAVLSGETSAAAAVLGPAGVPLSAAPTGPAGVAFEATTSTGAPGVPLGQVAVGPTGSPLGTAAVGPDGVPMGGTGIGPTASPLRRVLDVVRRRPIPAIVGAAAVLAIVVGATVAASGNDVSTQQPDAPLSSDPALVDDVVAVETLPGIQPVVETVAPIDTTAPSTTELVTRAPAVTCTAGSWIGDNESLAGAFTQALASMGEIALDSVAGSVLVQIGTDGTVVATFTDWVITANIAGSDGTVTVNGVESYTIDFVDDGTYTVTSSQIASQMHVEAAGFVLLDQQSPDAMFKGSSTFTCSGNQLGMVIPALVDYTATFTRSG